MLKGYIPRGTVVAAAMVLRGLYFQCYNGSQDVNVITCLT
jgi:hypothetical protein